MSRPSMEAIMLDFAILLSRRSTCQRRQVGCVITDDKMLRVLGIGYNGNASGLPNQCDDKDKSGGCGCIHAEENALIKSLGTESGRLFTSCAPCLQCAKRILNTGIRKVIFNDDYRSIEGVYLLRSRGILVGVINKQLQPDYTAEERHVG